MPSPGLSSTWGREDWSATLIEALSLESVLLQAGASRIVGDGRVIHVPRLLVAPDADWVAELTELPSDAGDADTLDLTPKKIGNVVELSRESIEDAPVNELDAVGRAMVRGVAKKLDAKFFSNAAATATAPAGIRSYTLPGSATPNPDVAGIITAVGAIEAAGGNPDAVFLKQQRPDRSEAERGQWRVRDLRSDRARCRADCRSAAVQRRHGAARRNRDRQRGAVHRVGDPSRRERRLLGGLRVHAGCGRGAGDDARRLGTVRPQRLLRHHLMIKRYKVLTDLVVGGKAQKQGSMFTSSAEAVRHALAAGLVESAPAKRKAGKSS